MISHQFTDMLKLIVLSILIFSNGISTSPFKITRQHKEAIRSIVSEYVKNSATPDPLQDLAKVFKWAETVNECRKFLGTYSRIKRFKTSIKDETAFDYQYENNTESENNIPTWPISPSDIDKLFDASRFDRCLKSMEEPSFDRRITWLYPNDGKRD